MQDMKSPAWAALAEYARIVDARLPDLVYGVYVHGSALVGDFDLAKSDVDFVSVTQGEVSNRELKALLASKALIFVIATQHSAGANACPVWRCTR